MTSEQAMHKNKTIAAFLALIAGWGGVHRLYLRGFRDKLALLHLGCVAASALLMALMPQSNIFYRLLPVALSGIAGLIEGLTIGLMPDEKFDARFNPGSGRRSDSRWPLALVLVASMLVGASALIGAMARLSDLLYTGGIYG